MAAKKQKTDRMFAMDKSLEYHATLGGAEFEDLAKTADNILTYIYQEEDEDSATVEPPRRIGFV